MFGALGKAKQAISFVFTSKLALESGLEGKLNVSKKFLAVKNCRNIGKKDMVLNNSTPKIEIDPETYQVKIDGKPAVTKPATSVSLARRYNLF
jgi:urease subunit alpha